MGHYPEAYGTERGEGLDWFAEQHAFNRKQVWARCPLGIRWIFVKNIERSVGKMLERQINKLPTCTRAGKWMKLFGNSKLVKYFDTSFNPFVSN